MSSLNWNIEKALVIHISHASLVDIGINFERIALKLIHAWHDRLKVYPHAGWYEAIKYGNVLFEFCTPYTPLHDWTAIKRHISVSIIDTMFSADILASLLSYDNVENLVVELQNICNTLLIQVVHES